MKVCHNRSSISNRTCGPLTACGIAQHFFLLGILALGLVGGKTLAYDGAPVWTNTFNNGNAKGDHNVTDIAVDTGGNVYVTGYALNTVSGYDIVTLKYSSAGSRLWSNRFAGPGEANDQPYAIAVDSVGSAYVAGATYIEGNGLDFVAIKYSSSGSPVWTNTYNGAAGNSDVATSIAIDSNGNAFVTGYSSDGLHYGFVTIKYSNAGLALWTNQVETLNGVGEPSSVRLDASGNVYVSGSSDPGLQSGFDYAIVKYSNAGLSLWTNRYHASGYFNDRNKFLAVDPSGNAYVTGSSAGLGVGQDFATVKYSSDGTSLWTNRFNGSGNADERLPSIAVDSDGNVVITGYSINAAGDYDYATIKYSAAGEPLWTNVFNGAGHGVDGANGLSLDAGGNVYVTGQSVSSRGDYDAVTIKYSPSGVALWTNIFNGAGNGSDLGNVLAADGSSAVYVAGFSTSATGNYNFFTVKYAGPPQPLKFATDNASMGFTNGQFFLTLYGPANSNAVISASSDLQTWNPLSTNQLIGGTLRFIDENATNLTLRFFRAEQR